MFNSVSRGCTAPADFLFKARGQASNIAELSILRTSINIFLVWARHGMRNDHICRNDVLPGNDRVGAAGAPAPDLPTETDVPVLLPLLPSADRLLPYLRRIDETRNYSNHGPLSRELEERLASALALPEGGLVCASSGTAAIVGAILATAGPGTPQRPLAIIPAYTFAATASAVEQCGYQPYLADVDRKDWTLDADRLIDHAERQRVGLVVPVAPFGRPVAQEPWRRFAAKTGIPVVIDGAASFAGLAERPREFLGAIPVAISFHATKAFATGEGGAVATSDVELAQRSEQALNFGISDVRDCSMASTNGKMSEYHASVGLAELDGWPEKLALFCTVAERYRQMLAASGLGDRFYGAPEIGPNYPLFRCRDAAEAGRVEEYLSEADIGFRLWYGTGLHHQTYYANLPRDTLGVTDDIARLLLGLPMAPDLDQATIGRIVGVLADAVRHNK
jgi:dTDP-4-amino-4,6-dideoxygalactose transaminase